MNLKIKKRITFILCLMVTFTFTFGTFAHADSTSDAQNKLENVEQQKEDVGKEIAAVTEDIKVLQKEVDGINADMNKTASQIESTEAKIVKKQEELQERETNLNGRLRAMYKNGSVGFIDILLGSSSISELISNMEMVQRIYSNDMNVLDTLEKEHTELEAIKSELSAQKADLAQQQEELNVQKKELDVKKSELEAKEDQLEADARALEGEIQRLLREAEAKRKAAEEAKKKAEQETQAQQSQTTESTSSSESSSSETSSSEVDNSTGTGKWIWPCPSSHYITSYFGYRLHPVLGIWKYHSGMDIGASTGADILAADSGTVIMSQWYAGYGNCVIIDHGGGLTSLYGHASQLLVSAGQTVSKGQRIALIGSTGISSGPHLHLEARINGVVTDPLDYL